MQTSVTPISDPAHVASIVIVATDELHHLRTCLPPLSGMDRTAYEVIVVDNASRDATGPTLAREFPWVKVLRSECRLGFAAANNLAFECAGGDYLIGLNPDTQPDPDFANELVSCSRALGDGALVTALVGMYDRPEVTNAYGNVVNFGMLASCRGIEQPMAKFGRTEPVAAISGCAFLIPRDVLSDIGGFDETTQLYLEDTELSIRAWLLGYTCVACSTAIVLHKYQLKMTPQKFRNIERNRWTILLRIYKAPSVVLLLPALGLIEMMAWGYAGVTGRSYLGAKAQSYLDIIRLLPTVRVARRALQQRRRRSDHELLRLLDTELPVERLLGTSSSARRSVVLANSILATYLAIVRWLARW
jgi:GT2 family glycosyltransferase